MTTDLSIEKFEPTESQLRELAKSSEDALSLDLNDETQLDLFKSRKKDLQQARLDVTRTGKSLREDALKFQKDVIAKEKSYLAIITPLEDKLKEKYDAWKDEQVREERRAELPERRKMLDEIGDGVEVSDDELLGLDHDAFVSYMNERKSAYFDKLQAEQREREAAARREQEIKEAEERAAAAAKEAAERAAQEALDAEKRRAEEAERKLAEEEARKEREAAEAARRAEEEKAAEEERAKNEAQDVRYQSWLEQYGVTDSPRQFLIKKNDDKTHSLYKLIDTFTFE